MVRQKKNHIVHVLPSLKITGVSAVLSYMLRSENFKHFKHSIISLRDESDEYLKKENVAVYGIYKCPFIWPNPNNFFSYRFGKCLSWLLRRTFQRRLRKTIKACGADLLHVHAIRNVDQVLSCISDMNIPCVWTIHNYFERGVISSQQLSTVNKVMSNEKSVIVAVGDQVKRNYEDVCECVTPPVKVIYNGVPAAEPVKPGKKWRDYYGIPNNSVVFGSVGRLEEQKNYNMLLASFYDLCITEHNIFLLIAGEGSMRADLQKRIEELGLEGKAHLIGYTEDIPSFLSGLDVFVLSSDLEGMAISLLEAASYGLPCISTNAGAAVDILSNGTGVVVPLKDITKLTLAMKKMCDSKVRKAYSLKVREHAARYSVDACVKSYSRLYEELLNK